MRLSDRVVAAVTAISDSSRVSIYVIHNRLKVGMSDFGESLVTEARSELVLPRRDRHAPFGHEISRRSLEGLRLIFVT